MLLKAIVYVLLALNFMFYLHEDWTTGQHALVAAPTIAQYLQNYASSLDFAAWMVLIAIFDIETYWLDDDFDNVLVERFLVLAKYALYAVILQTTYAYILDVINWHKATPLAGVPGLCDMADKGYSFLRNLRYVDITPQTCAGIANDGQYFLAHNEPVITDGAGQAEDKALHIADLIENVSWLVVIAMTDLSVRMQNKGLHEGRFVTLARAANSAAYCAIILVSAYWITKGHYVYAWDEFVWISGFWMLDRNLAQWREDLKQEQRAHCDEAA